MNQPKNAAAPGSLHDNKTADRVNLTIARTPAPGCSACEYKRRHTPEDWRNHPEAGKGRSKEHGAPGPIEAPKARSAGV